MSAPARGWDTLARIIRERRWQLGIPSQEAAAARAGVSPNTWHRLESGAQVGPRMVHRAATALDLDPGQLWAVVDGQPPAAEIAGVLPVDRPALVYLATDGRVVQLDRDDLTTMTPRERALCAALLDHARHQLDQTSTPSLPATPTGIDHEEDPNA
ncbi:helix-turn-helix domain-containing protein [Microbispora rosea]|uniref:helix-turn-helix domain-containing protein n=1 Tax=Microbispora rosea TaxID=58117 RepID=UPI0037A6767F